VRLRFQQEKEDLRFRIVTVPEVQEDARRNGMEMEKK